MESERILKIRLFILLEKSEKEFKKMYYFHYNIYPTPNQVKEFKDAFISYIKNEFALNNFVDIFSEYMDYYNIDLYVFVLFEKLTKLAKYKVTKDDIAELSLMDSVSTFFENNDLSNSDNRIIKRISKLILTRKNDLKNIESDISNKILLSNFLIYKNEIIKYSVLSTQEERQLIYDYQINGNRESLNEIIVRNQRLVLSISLEVYLHNYYRKVDADIMDLIQEGNFGLRDSIIRFDLNRQTKLSTYAYRNIKQKMQRYLENNGRTVRVPVHKNGEINKLYSLESMYRQELGRELTDKDREELIYSKLPYNKEEPLYNKLSLDEKVSRKESDKGSDNLYLIDTIADSSVESAEEKIERLSERELIDQALDKYIHTARNNKYSKRNALIFRLRYGLFDDECSKIIEEHHLKLRRIKCGVLVITSEQLTKVFGINISRVQAIEVEVFQFVSKALIPYENELTGVNYIYDEKNKRAIRKR